MKNRTLLIVLIIIIIGFSIYAFRDKIFNKNPEVSQTAIPAAAPVMAYNERPDLPITHINGSQQNVNEIKGKTVLIFFQPDCDHCQREAVQIQQNLSAFKEYQLYFISDAALPQVAEFAQTYKLAGNPSIHFSQTTIADIMRTIGAVQVPSVYVYSNEGKLVKSFIGETPIGSILAVL